MCAELMGKATGVNGGRGGSAYLSVPEVGMMGQNSIVGFERNDPREGLRQRLTAASCIIRESFSGFRTV